MVGADICGFGWNTNVELCARWQAVGAFYPFSRNHNDNNAIEQDPVVLGKVVVDATKNSLEIRYKLLPYLYTTFYENSITGHPVIRAPFWDHSWDSESETQASHQFLWGSALMIVPILEEGKSEVRGYFPTRSNWYNYADLKQLKSENEESREYWFHVPWEEITVTLRGNSVVPYHTETKLSIAEQKESASFGLFVVLSSNGEAKGQLFWDDGETSDTLLTGDYSLIEFHCKARTFKSNTKRYGFHMKPLTEIKVLGVSKVVNLVLLNGVSIQTYNYDEKSQVLFIRDLQQNFRDSFTLSWS
jgi:alpha-glucosidase (family GH31 glycosyl hydrolase)